MQRDRTADVTPTQADLPAPRPRPTVRARCRTALLATALFGAMASLATALPAPPAAAASAVAVTAQTREPLRVCADPDNLPFSSADGKVRGLSLEIAQLVADALGRPLEPVWTVAIFGKRTLRTTLLAGQCDAFVGLPESSDFMGKRLIYSQPLFSMGYALALPAGQDMRNVAELDGKRVGVQFGTPPQSLLATRPAVTPVTFMDPGAAMTALSRGDIDAAFVWGPVAGWLNSTELASRFHVVPVAAPVAGMDMQWPVGIGFARQRTALRDEVDHALAGLGDAIGQVAQKYGVPMQAPLRFAAATTTWPRNAGIVLAAASSDEVVTMEQFVMGEQLAMARPTGKLDLENIGLDASAGRSIFNSTCAHCHGPNAEQAVTRINLRLLKHRYGERMDDVFITTVTHGRPSKGMPNWSGILSDDDFMKIRAFLHAVQQTD
jgi:ABC-type amino acid transport substrate-binding protein/mono/diheme cytochrome c family protein